MQLKRWFSVKHYYTTGIWTVDGSLDCHGQYEVMPKNGRKSQSVELTIKPFVYTKENQKRIKFKQVLIIYL